MTSLSLCFFLSSGKLESIGRDRTEAQFLRRAGQRAVQMPWEHGAGAASDLCLS